MAVSYWVVSALLIVAGLAIVAAGRRKAGALAPSRLSLVAMLLCATLGVVAGVAWVNGVTGPLALAVAVTGIVILLWRPEAVLLIIAAFPWLDWSVRRSFGGLGPLWDDALLAVSIALLLWAFLVLGRGRLWSVPVALPVLLTAAAAVGSIVVRGVPADVGVYALRVLFEPILFYFVGFLFPKSLRWVRWSIAVFIVASSALAFHGLYQYLTGAPMPANWVDVSETGIAVRAYSVVQNPNVLGAVLVMGALISGSLAFARSSAAGWRLALAGACIVQLAGLAVTFSRSAWIGLVFGVLAIIALGYRRFLVPFIAVGVVAWFAAPRVFVERVLFTFSSTYVGRSSGSGRLFRWEAALHQIAEHPLLGAGFGTFGGTAAYMFGYWALWVDNFYLQMAAEGGLLLLAFFLWVLLRGAKGLVKAHGLSPTPYLKAVTAGTFGAFVAVAVANVFAGDWETLAIGVEYWFLAGLVTSAAFDAASVAGSATKPSGESEGAR
jgi:O-antigen ligase